MSNIYSFSHLPPFHGSVEEGGRAAKRVQMLDDMSAAEATAHCQKYPDFPVLMTEETASPARPGRVAVSLVVEGEQSISLGDCDYNTAELRAIHRHLVTIPSRTLGYSVITDRLGLALEGACGAALDDRAAIADAMTFAAALATCSGQYGRKLLAGRIRSCTATLRLDVGGKREIEFCFGHAPRPKRGKAHH